MAASFFRLLLARTAFAALAAFVLFSACAPERENSFYKVEGEGIGSAKIAKGAP